VLADLICVKQKARLYKLATNARLGCVIAIDCSANIQALYLKPLLPQYLSVVCNEKLTMKLNLSALICLIPAVLSIPFEGL